MTTTAFSDTQFATAEDKARFVKQLLAFVESDFKETLFHKTLYSRLMYLFGHIAHYDKVGFYDEWFSSDTRKLSWISNVINWPDFYGDWADVERFVQNRISSMGLQHRYRLRVANQTEERERAELARLKAKYEGAR